MLLFRFVCQCFDRENGQQRSHFQGNTYLFIYLSLITRLEYAVKCHETSCFDNPPCFVHIVYIPLMDKVVQICSLAQQKAMLLPLDI